MGFAMGMVGSLKDRDALLMQFQQVFLLQHRNHMMKMQAASTQHSLALQEHLIGMPAHPLVCLQLGRAWVLNMCAHVQHAQTLQAAPSLLHCPATASMQNIWIEVVKLYREGYLQSQEDERGEGGQLKQDRCQCATHIL